MTKTRHSGQNVDKGFSLFSAGIEEPFTVNSIMMETSGIDGATTRISHSLYKGVLGVACVQLYSVMKIV